jgi:hypothetical protein
MRFVFLLVIVHINTCVHAQQFSVTNQIPDFHLPTQEVYKVIQDKKGYLWFATDFGLYRYQQGSVDKISLPQNFGQPPVLTVYETTNGKILFATFTGNVFAVEKDTAIELPFSQKGYMGKFKEIVYRFTENERQQLYLFTSLGTYRISSDFRQAKRIGALPFDGIPILFEEGSLIPLNTNYLLQEIDSRPTFTRFMLPGLIQDTISVKLYGIPVRRYRILTARWRDFHVVTYSNSLLLIRPGHPVKEIQMGAPVITLRIDRSDGLWIGLYKSGYRYFDNPANMSNPVKGLEEISVSDICTDNDGGVWFTSLERGVFYSQGMAMLQHSAEEQTPSPFTKTYQTDQGIIAALYGKPAVLIPYDNAKPHQPKNIKPLNNLLHYSETDQYRYFYNESDVIIQRRRDGNTITIPGNRFFLTAGLNIGSNCFLTATTPEITIYDRHVKTKTIPVRERIFHLELTVDSGLLAGTHNGVYYTDHYRDTVLKKASGDSGRVVQLFKTSGNHCWVLIQARGLFLFKEGKLIKLLPARSDERYYAGAEGKDGSLWIASSGGVRIYNEQDILLGKNSVGYPATDQVVYSFTPAAGRMYMASIAGVVSLPLNPVNKKDGTIPVYLRSWTNGNIELPIAGSAVTQVFDYNSGTLTWTYDIASIRPEQALLYYILEGPVKNDSGRIDGKRLQLGNLRPGNYQLKVWAVRDDGSRSATLTQSFRIKPPYWQSKAFVAIILILTIAFVVACAWWIVRRIRKRDERRRKMENELLSIRLQALQAQMNPHFVFNAINSIQLFILQHKELEAYHYLTQFSKLIRRVLTQSRNPLISLADELETLQLYAGLEQLRFPDRFTFTIHKSETLPDATHIYLPGMLLQPVIENAILHGMPDNPEPGKIALEITGDAERGCITFQIRDNGTKKNKAAITGRPSHEPVSSVINHERILTLNKIYNTEKFSLKIIHADGVKSGTRVTISIPDNLNSHGKV